MLPTETACKQGTTSVLLHVHGKKFGVAAAIIVVARRTTVVTRQQRHFWTATVLKRSTALLSRLYNDRGCCCTEHSVSRSPHAGTAVFPKYERCRPMQRVRCGLLFSAMCWCSGYLKFLFVYRDITETGSCACHSPMKHANEFIDSHKYHDVTETVLCMRLTDATQ